MPHCHTHDIFFLPRMGFVDKLSHHGFADVTTRPDGVYGTCDEPDDARSARVATEPECDPFTTVQVQSRVQITIGPFRGVRLCFPRLTCVTSAAPCHSLEQTSAVAPRGETLAGRRRSCGELECLFRTTGGYGQRHCVRPRKTTQS